MGYDFTADGASFRLDDWQMGFVHLVMLESGVTAGDRLFGNERFAPSADTLPAGHLAPGTAVTAAQSTFIATRLRAALTADLIGDMALFYADQPTQLRDWVDEFATFNATAAAHGGYRIQ